MADMVRGISAVVRNLEKMSKDIEAGARKARLRAGGELEREYVANIDSMKIVDTGYYKESAAWKEVDDIVEVGAIKEGSDVEYAHLLEVGTSKIVARPALQTAVELARQKYPKMIIEDVKAEIL